MTLKHRHFLAAPLFALSLLITVAGVSGNTRAQIAPEAAPAGEITAVGTDKTFTLPRGVRGLLREDGVLHDDGSVLTLRQGTLVVASGARTDAQIGDVFLSAFRGGFLVTHNGSKFSIHALTSPVLVERGTFRLIIPAGMQGSWTAEDQLPSVSDAPRIAAERQRLQMIPNAALRDGLTALAALPPGALPPLPSAEQTLPPVLDFFILSGAQKDTAATTEARLGELLHVLESGDAASARQILRDRDLQNALVRQLPGDTAAALLARAEQLPSVAQEILLYSADPALWLLLSFHRDYQAAAWETPGPLLMESDARVLRWLQLPSSDVGGDAVPVLAIERWAQQTGRYVGTLTSPQDFLEPLLRSLRGYKAFAAARGYPQRLQRIARALTTVVEPHRASLSADALALYAEWQDLDAIAPYAEPAALPPPVVDAAEPATVPVSEIIAEPFDAVAAEARAKQMLLSAGALFTTETALHAESASMVTVENLLFASADGEHRYDFDLDLTGHQLKKIYRDRQLLPYPMAIGAFGTWAGGAKE